jgi:ribosomal protein S18 acetylase RimI-like enzyme
MDYTKYPIKQINSADIADKEDVLRRIITTTANPFKGKLPIEVFVETEMRVARGAKEPWHQFYVADHKKQELTIVSSFRIMHKRGNNNNVNLLIGNVHTNPEYRKQGFVAYLVSECIKKYEVPGYKFKAIGSDNEVAEAYIADHVRPDNYNYYWTLYSGVSELYAKFGFKSVPEMNWLIYEEPVSDKSLVSASELEGYPNGETQVTLLKTGSDLSSINQYFSDPAYASYVNANASPLVRSTNLQNPMVHNFYTRDAVVSSYYARSYKYVGLKIFHPEIGKQTFAIICGAIDYSGILVQKLFTDLSVESEDQTQLLAQDLAYVVKFLRHVHVADYSLLALDFITSIKLLLTIQDIHTKDKETHDYVVSILIKDWRLDTSNKDFLPMMKDWAKPSVSNGVKWINNGFWCFG